MTSWFRRNRQHRPPDEQRGGTGAGPDASVADVTPLHNTLSDAGAASAEPDADAADTSGTADERRALLQLCLYALDRARSTGVVERLEDGLAQVGVTAIRPNGVRFDPGVHDAGGTMPTDDPALDGTIAETEVPGFVDRGVLLRAPVVTVYTVRSR